MMRQRRRSRSMRETAAIPTHTTIRTLETPEQAQRDRRRAPATKSRGSISPSRCRRSDRSCSRARRLRAAARPSRDGDGSAVIRRPRRPRRRSCRFAARACGSMSGGATCSRRTARARPTTMGDMSSANSGAGTYLHQRGDAGAAELGAGHGQRRASDRGDEITVDGRRDARPRRHRRCRARRRSAGRILDEYGDPIENADVRAASVSVRSRRAPPAGRRCRGREPPDRRPGTLSDLRPRRPASTSSAPSSARRFPAGRPPTGRATRARISPARRVRAEAQRVDARRRSAGRSTVDFALVRGRVARLSGPR